MVVRCRDLIRLPSLKAMTLVGGADGLDRIVTWPYIVQMNSVCEWLHGGELLFVTGIGIKTDIESLKSLISESYTNNLAGVVLMVGNLYIKNIPPAVIALADYLKVPLFKIPWEVHLVEMTRDIGDYIIRTQNGDEIEQSLMAEMLFGQAFDEQAKTSRASSFGYDLSRPHLVAVLGLSKAGAKDVPMTGERMEYYQQTARSMLSQGRAGEGEKLMAMVQGNTVVMLLPAEGENSERAAAERLGAVCKTLTEKFESLRALCGVGRAYAGAEGIRSSYSEARRALEAAEKMNTGKMVFCYLDLGLFRLVHDIADEDKIASYCNENIGRLLEYDSLNDASLVHTLEVYFENKFNLSQTAKALYIHRNSLIYRLRRIREVLGRDINDPYILLDILNSIMVLKLQSRVPDVRGGERP